MRRRLLIAAFAIIASSALTLMASNAWANSAAKCYTTNETGANIILEILDNGFIVGDICVDDCACGTVLGEAHAAELDGFLYGTLDFYADLP